MITENWLQTEENVKNLAIKFGRDPFSLKIVAVSKFQPLKSIQEAFNAGCTLFGENRVQESLQKIDQLDQRINWHFIGTLQKNKVKKIIGKFDLIHSVDSLELAQKISEESIHQGIITKILLQVNTTNELSKHGMGIDAMKNSFPNFNLLSGIKVDGLMTIGPTDENEKAIRQAFNSLRKLRDFLRDYSNNAFILPHLSMGMSGDYPIAIEEGATLLRIGSAIFGKRN